MLRAKGRLGATRKLSTSPPSLLMRAEVCTSVHGTDYTSVGSQEAGKLDRSEVEGRVAPGLARWLREVVPGDLRRQLDDGGGNLARAATTAIPRAIARASHAASAKGSPHRTAGVPTATVGPRHFLAAQGCRFRHTSKVSAFKNAQDARSASTQLDRHSQRHRRQF